MDIYIFATTTTQNFSWPDKCENTKWSAFWNFHHGNTPVEALALSISNLQNLFDVLCFILAGCLCQILKIEFL